ncbi:Hypothetical predicted protein [Mytilus galloprovincialis]|uniref:Uncharacterized protein n=1 Tax=Mytilus galloprovincialis TaxID=29158 RepID=A0A8B6G3P2_MYTGA|nr:Hypothetical predicted protein [Mytilus galloprovincialis]
MFCIEEDKIEDKYTLRNPVIPADNFLLGMACCGRTESLVDGLDGDVYLYHLFQIFNESFPLKRRCSKYTRDIDYLMKKVTRDVEKYCKVQGYDQRPIYSTSLRCSLFLQGDD